MSNNSKYTKSDFIRLIMSTIEFESCNKEASKEFLSQEGENVDSVISSDMKRLKRLQLQIEAEKTRTEMQHAEDAKQKAIEWVNKLLSKIDFSIPELIKQEGLVMSFRNVEDLSEDDIKEILVKHFTLKFLEEQENKDK